MSSCYFLNCFDPCAFELTQLRDWEMLLITTAAHINHETLMIIYNYKYFDYIQMKSASLKTKFNIPFFFVQYITQIRADQEECVNFIK